MQDEGARLAASCIVQSELGTGGREAAQPFGSPCWHGACCSDRHAMTDLVLILVTIGFFAVAILYVAACDRL